MINVGKLRHRITIMLPDTQRETVDEYGRRQTPMRVVAQVFAAVNDVSGREYYEAAAHQRENTVTFTLRWLSGLTPSMWIDWAGSMYQIDQINHLGYRRDFLRIKAHAVEAEGGQPYGQN